MVIGISLYNVASISSNGMSATASIKAGVSKRVSTLALLVESTISKLRKDLATDKFSAMICVLTLVDSCLESTVSFGTNSYVSNTGTAGFFFVGMKVASSPST